MIGLDREANDNRVRAPGVYIGHRVESTVLGLETGLPLFVGFATLLTPPANRPNFEKHGKQSRLTLLRIESAKELLNTLANAVDGGYLLSAVLGFFDNGGKRCVVAAIDNPCGPLDFELSQLFQTGGALELVDDVDLVCVPDAQIDSIASSTDQVLAIQHLMLAYCERMGDRFAILDGPKTLLENLSSTHLDTGSSGIGLPVSANGGGAIYAPWIVLSGSGPTAVRMVPPCGHVAGIYARCDRLVGPHQPPANEVIEGAVDLAMEVSDNLQSQLNSLGVNCLRSFPGRGIRVWGARTLSSRPGWRYVNVRRLFLSLTRWLEITMADLVMEPNNETLWAQIRRRTRSYCADLMKRGALVGRDPSEAYVVKCDAETNPPEIRDQGMLVTVIGLAAVVPAEFLYVRVAQSASGTVATPILR